MQWCRVSAQGERQAVRTTYGNKLNNSDEMDKLETQTTDTDSRENPENQNRLLRSKEVDLII